MVSVSPPIIERIPTTDPNTGQHSDISNSGGIHHPIRSSTVGCLATIWHCCRTGGSQKEPQGYWNLHRETRLNLHMGIADLGSEIEIPLRALNWLIF